MCRGRHELLGTHKEVEETELEAKEGPKGKNLGHSGFSSEGGCCGLYRRQLERKRNMHNLSPSQRVDVTCSGFELRHR